MIARTCIPALTLAVLAVTARGEEKPTYPFAHEPEKAVVILSRLGSLSGYTTAWAADEKALARDVRAGRFRMWSLEEAALVASGVTYKAKRKPYLDKLQRIRLAAGRAVSGAKTPAEKGKKLLVYLHKGPMAKGYEAHQTTLTGVLSQGQFNCVSSALLYNALAARLGLQVDAVEVPGGLFTPGHVFSRVKAGKDWLVVEATNAQGFSARREKDSTSRPLTEPALVAVIWYNRGLDASGAGRYHEAAALNLLALSLDPTSASAANNLTAALTKWSLELKEKGRFAASLRVILAGLEIAPKDGTLLNNRTVVYTHWAEHLAKAGKADEALAVLRRAIKVAPAEAEYFEGRQAWVFLAMGEELVEKGEWARAHDAVAIGRTKLTGKALEKLIAWQQSVYLRWGNSLLEAGKHSEACAVLLAGRKLYAKEERLVNNLKYTLQEWLSAALEKQGEDRARELAADLRKQHAGLEEIDQLIAAHVRRVVDRHTDAGKYAEAHVAVGRHGKLVSKEQALELTRLVVDRQAGVRLDKGDWKGALAVYTEALKKLPGDAHLTNNAVVVWDQQAKKLMEGKAWEKAVAVYAQALKQFPDDGLLRNNIEYCREQQKNGK